MFNFFGNNKEKIVKDKVKNINKTNKDSALDNSLSANIDMLKELFIDVDILRIRYIGNNNNDKLKYCLVYSDGVVNSAIINDSIIKPLMLSDAAVFGSNLINSLMNDVIMINEAEVTNDINKIIEAITYGDTVLFADGSNEAILLNTKGFTTRSIAEPDNEKTLTGPREGFNEALLQNLSLIRRKLRTNELKMKFYTLGKKTKTSACICYVDGIVNKKLLKELYRRLDTIDIDAVLDTNYITELIRDSPKSPFRATGYTERPDVVVGKLLEGRVAIFLDGTPTVLTVPYLFIENFQSSEDYYLSFYYTSFTRILRIIGFILTITIPGLYIAIVAFSYEMIPTSLLMNIARERSGAPLPAAMEALVILIVFDILKETGIRMPTGIGQALSIVGALVIGQAAVAAKLVAAPMIIVVALTGITGLLVPKLNAPIIYARALLFILSATFGLFGIVIGLSAVLIHIINLRSFGVPQMSLIGSLKYQDIKDIYIRAPWWSMITRPQLLAKDKVRMKVDNGGHDE